MGDVHERCALKLFKSRQKTLKLLLKIKQLELDQYINWKENYIINRINNVFWTKKQNKTKQKLKNQKRKNVKNGFLWNNKRRKKAWIQMSSCCVTSIDSTIVYSPSIFYEYKGWLSKYAINSTIALKQNGCYIHCLHWQMQTCPGTKRFLFLII